MHRRALGHSFLRLLAASITVIGLLGGVTRAAPARAANGVVGDGHASSCTPQELRNVVGAVQATGGGVITFACGDPQTGYNYLVDSMLTISTSVTFEGGTLGAVNLGSGDVPLHRVFHVLATGRLTLNNMIVSLGIVPDGYGGCILNSGGTVTLHHSVVHTCRSGPPFVAAGLQSPTGSPASSGGAIFNDNGVVTLVNSEVLSSSAESGGGIKSFGSLSLTNSRVAGNLARDFGGGLSVTGAITIVDSLIEHNAVNGTAGGLNGTSGTHLTLINSRVYSNTAVNDAGGLYSQDVLTSTNSQFDENEAGADGGGLYLPAGTASLDRTLIRGNRAGGDGGGLFNDESVVTIANGVLQANITPTNTVSAGSGGAIYSEGPLAIRDSLVQDNVARNGGGLMVAGALTPTIVAIDRTTFSGNQSSENGGGVWVDNVYTHILLTDVLIRGNQALNGGGMVHHYGGASLNRVTISGNEAVELGGGYYDHDTGYTEMTNVTLSGNTAGDSGGGLHTAQMLTLTNVTVANNTALNTGGIHFNGSLFPFTLRNVLLADNANANCSGPVGTFIFSMSTDNSCAFGGGSNANAPLGPLQINGGLGGFLLPTHLPLAGSDAINGGTTSGCPAVDQRGATRPAGGGCDVGAVEADSPLPRLALPLLRR